MSMSMSMMREVVPGLFLGSWSDAVAAMEQQQSQQHQSQQPVFVVNCSKELPMLGRPGEGLRVPVDDDGSCVCNDAMLSHLGAATAAIRDRLAAGDRVLVHCKAGQQRSPAVVAAYLMASAPQGVRTGSCGVDLAMSKVCARKPDAFFWTANFRDALERFGKDLSEKTKAI